MEISEFATQLLFGKTWEDKLVFPSLFEDTCTKPLIKVPTLPGRPDSLKFAAAGTRVRFPSIQQLEKDDWARGAVFHFFANHELLAIELMALVLLKFPNANSEFRKSMIHTIKEEQEHLLLYVERMQEFGIHFGEIPVNDFFWRSCSSLKTPEEYLLSLSLTFEQANLDYSKYYQKPFAKIGDKKSWELLQKVYLDEIGHVGNGLKWLNKWRKPDQKLWSYFVQNLPTPLTPQRAKGLDFDLEGRKKAGLDDDFIQEIRRFGHSKGKLPDFWHFRPGGEWELADLNRPKAAMQLERDLGSLAIWLAGPDDLVYSKEKISENFKDLYLKTNERLPELEHNLCVLKQRKFGQIHYWDFTPRVHEEFGFLLENGPTWQQYKFSALKEEWVQGRHRKHSLRLEHLLKTKMSYKKYCYSDGIHITNSSDLQQIKMLDWSKTWVFKESYSSSGYGVQFFHNQQEALSWVQQKSKFDFIIEPYFEKICDLSFLFDFSPNGHIIKKGITQFLTSNSGRYQGHYVGKYTHGLSKEVLRVLHTRIGTQTQIQKIQNELAEFLPQVWPNYSGPIGVDAMVVRVGNELKIRPVVEINFRHTMGFFALKLKDVLAAGKSALFAIKPCNVIAPDNFVLKNQKLIAGEMPLHDTNVSKKFGASLKII